MADVTNTSQLSIFDLIKAAIVANATLSAKFNASNIYQFEPKHKSGSFKGFPYIWINLPDTSTDLVTLNHSSSDKELSVRIIMRMDYMARDKFLSYANALIYQLEATEATFESSGYYHLKVDLSSVESVAEDEKELVEGAFLLRVLATVAR